MDSSLQLDARGVIIPCPSCGTLNRVDYTRLHQQPRCGRCGATVPSPAAAVAVESREHFLTLLARASVPVLVDFWAEWCGPCKMIAPEVAKAAARGTGRWLVLKVDTEQQPELAAQFQVRAIPLLVLFQGGREVARKAGALPAPAIEEFIRSGVSQAG